MQKIIISDTSCLILLEKIGQLDLLHKLFGTVITTPEVLTEYGLSLPTWIDIKEVANKQLQHIIEEDLDKGEASAIALAVEIKDCLLIIDEIKGRNYAAQLGLLITGTMGIIIEAKLSAIIPSVKPLLQKIKETNFRLSPHLEKIILNKAGE